MNVQSPFSQLAFPNEKSNGCHWQDCSQLLAWLHAGGAVISWLAWSLTMKKQEIIAHGDQEKNRKLQLMLVPLQIPMVVQSLLSLPSKQTDVSLFWGRKCSNLASAMSIRLVTFGRTYIKVNIHKEKFLKEIWQNSFFPKANGWEE